MAKKQETGIITLKKKILEKRLLYRKGKLKRTYTYNLKGQLAVIEDDKGNVHTKPACGCQ